MTRDGLRQQAAVVGSQLIATWRGDGGPSAGCPHMVGSSSNLQS